MLTKEKIQYLWEQAQDETLAFDDLETNPDRFVASLADQRSLFYEIGDGVGLVGITNIQPSFQGTLSFTMYDRKLKDKDGTLRDIVKRVMYMLELRRMNSFVCEDRETVANTLVRLGFKREGTLRQAAVRGGKFMNVHLFGLLGEEVA